MSRPNDRPTGRSRLQRRISDSTYVPSVASTPVMAGRTKNDAIPISEDSDSDDSSVSQVPASGPIMRPILPRARLPLAPNTATAVREEPRITQRPSDHTPRPAQLHQQLGGPLNLPRSGPAPVAPVQERENSPLFVEQSDGRGDHVEGNGAREAPERSAMPAPPMVSGSSSAARAPMTHGLPFTPRPPNHTRQRPRSPSSGIEEVPRPIKRERGDDDDIDAPPTQRQRTQRSAAPTPATPRVSNARQQGAGRPTLDLHTIPEEWKVQDLDADTIDVNIAGTMFFVPRSEFIRLVKRQARRVFATAADRCLKANLRCRFRGYAIFVDHIDKVMLLESYDMFWKRELNDAAKSLKEQLKAAETRRDEHEWTLHKTKYHDDYVKPLQDRYRIAERRKGHLDQLVEMLRRS